MELIIIGSLIAVAIGMLAYGFLSGVGEKEPQLMDRLTRGGLSGPGGEGALDRKKKSTRATQLLQKAAPVFAKPVMPKSDVEKTNLRVKLANAGYRREAAPGIFLSTKTIFGLAAFGITMGVCSGYSLTTQKLIGYSVFAGALTFMLPNLWLVMAMKSRMEKITCGLPDAVDLLVVSVEAGLGLDQSMQRVGDDVAKVHPELAEELRITILEQQVGVSRAQALKNFATRTGVSDVKSLCAMLVQTERFGTSIARSLRVHAEQMRVKRRQRAEERAAKTSVKLTFPLVLFIFPAIFIVSAGPGVIKIIEALGGMSGK